MTTIEYDPKANKFLIHAAPADTRIVSGLPDRRFRKTSRTWAAPVLRRNIEYMAKFLNNPQMFSAEALDVFNKKRHELKGKPKGENKFPAWFNFKTEPFKYQRDGLEKFFPLNEAAIFYEQGLGKTFTSINLVTAWRMTNQIDSVIVICPTSIKLVWQEELEKHCPLPVQEHVVMAGKFKKTTEFTESHGDFQWLLVGIEGLSQGAAIEYVKKFMVGRKCAIIIDESSRIKTPGKTRTDRCVDLGKAAYKRVILSGTSITQGLEDLYTQFKFLNPDIVGFESFYSFRNHFCVLQSIEVQQDRFIQKIVGYKNEDEFTNLIASCTERLEKDDELDLPPKTFTNRYVTMNPAQKKIYAEMKEELFTEINGVEYEVTTVLEQMLRLQQITGGHYAVDDGEKITPTPIPGKNPKVTELMALMDEISGKVVIWCQFRAEVERVAEALVGAGIDYVEFHGGCSQDEKKSAKDKFTNDPETKVFLATRAAAYGLTLTAASTAIYFSQGYSLEEYSQSQDRIHRIGQNDNCNYIHLVCDRTIDTKIIKALRNKKTIADLIYSMMKGI